MTLHVEGRYFDQIRSGEKREEYRLVTPYWTKRLVGRHYDNVVIVWGYARNDDADKRLVFPWRGYEQRVIVHPHFGDKPVSAFVIPLSKTPDVCGV